MVVENTRRERLGTIMALAMSFSNSGLMAGPAISGTVFQLAGYWPIWAVPFALLTVDFIARLTMADRKPQPTSLSKPAKGPQVAHSGEAARLLKKSPSSYNTTEPPPESSKTGRVERQHAQDVNNNDSASSKSQPRGFYRVVLTDMRIWVGLSNNVIQTLIIVGFDTTLPLYLYNIFHWSTLAVGLIFLGIQGPQITIGPLIGNLRDRLDTRIMTVLGWLSLVVFLWLLGSPSEPTFRWAAPNSTNGMAIAITSIVGTGFGLLLVRGAGSFQLVGKLIDHLLRLKRLH